MKKSEKALIIDPIPTLPALSSPNWADFEVCKVFIKDAAYSADDSLQWTTRYPCGKIL